MSTVLEPLYDLKRKNVPWRWNRKENNAFLQAIDYYIKSGLDTVISHLAKVGPKMHASNVKEFYAQK